MDDIKQFSNQFFFLVFSFTVETNDTETENKPPEEKKEPAAVA